MNYSESSSGPLFSSTIIGIEVFINFSCSLLFATNSGYPTQKIIAESFSVFDPMKLWFKEGDHVAMKVLNKHSSF